jgi:diguanylate cyclase (GGDEF)-like protein/putative nucleotidyltransferase with HDIG domain
MLSEMSFTRRASEDSQRELALARQRIAELEAERAQLLRLDPSTGLLASRPFRGRLAEEVARAHRHGRSLTLVALAIDELDALTSRQGFRAGDQLLEAVARLLRAQLRTSDVLARSGPAEFALLLPESDAASARAALERVLVEMEQLGTGAGASIGLSELRRGMSAEVLNAEARAACARASALGGGRLLEATPAPAPDSRSTGTGAGAAAGPGGVGASGESEAPGVAPQQDAVEALAVALLERDRYTGEHSNAVIEMAVGVARKLGCSDAEVGRIRAAALLHDIGKVAIPDRILHKPAALSEEEWLLMREHPVIGERILRALPGMGAVARIVRHEHERWDGRGYPDGLAGEAIPLGSRIVIAADTYHAITSDRPYRAARSHQVAIEELTRCAGSQFDPDVTGALIGHLYGRRQAGAAAA